MASIYSVSQVNAYIKNMFSQDFALNRISIKGEVSNCKYHTSGHIYFTLKDGLAAIQAVMFASRRKGLPFQMQDGQQVVVKGSVEVYERDGRYQLYAQQIELSGAGDLFKRFEALRNQLEEMGMFAREYKRPIPMFARTVGVVTASTGAAIRDIMNISHRRNPYVQLILYPAKVQGDGAAESIAMGIERLDQLGVDVIIAGRGGGSIEDLWAFNEEEVARAIFECTTPVISAVGHETDVTIADYVADLRAPTPSAAAELAVDDYRGFLGQLAEYESRLERGLLGRLTLLKSRLEQYKIRMGFLSPRQQILERRQYLADIQEKIENGMKQKIKDSRHELQVYAQRLYGCSPLKKLTQGFSFVTDENGHGIHRVEQVKPLDAIRIQVTDGEIQAQVTGSSLVDREKWNV